MFAPAIEVPQVIRPANAKSAGMAIVTAAMRGSFESSWYTLAPKGKHMRPSITIGIVSSDKKYVQVANIR